MKYAWAAYKHAAFDWIKSGLSPDEFKSEFEAFVVSKCHAAWTVFAQTKRGFIPVGLIFASWAPNAPYLIISAGVWMPWASKRNIIEGTVGFINGVRRDFSLVVYALPEHKRMYEICMMHGIMRRVGTSYTAIPGHSAAMFETKMPDKKAA